MGNETEQIKDRLPIAEIVGEYVTLKQMGRSLKALCPFHQEKTPSFIVSPERQSWHCFGCNEGGDIFTFIQKIEGLDFPATLKLLAERAGVTLPTFSPVSGAVNQRQRLFDVLAAAARFYHHLLTAQKIGERGREYLIGRGLTPETIHLFQLGYAPSTWNSLQRWLARAGFTTEEMIAAGLVGKGSKGKFFDRFRGRIMFPITDVQGRVVAFGGRITPWQESGSEGKYINSPETSLYEKRRTVYNLSRAKMALRGGKSCLVVEGYMDVVMLVQHGIDNVVASSGTAFTGEQIGLLARFTKTLHFAFDADAAGFKAAVAATTAALTTGMNVATVLFPGGKDPADVALASPEKLAEYVAKPQPLVQILLAQLAQSRQEEPLQALLPFVAAVTNPIVQGEMIQAIAGSLHVPESSLKNLLSKQQMKARAPLQEPVAVVPAISDSISVKQERQLLGIILANTAVRQAVYPHLKAGYFLDQHLQELYNSLHTISQAHANFLSMPADSLVAALLAAQQSFAQAVRTQGEELERLSSNTPVQEGLALLRALQHRELQGKLQSLQKQLATAEGSTHQEALEEFRSVAAALAELPVLI